MFDASSKRNAESDLFTARVVSFSREKIQRSTVLSSSRSIAFADFSSLSMCISANRDAFQILLANAA